MIRAGDTKVILVLLVVAYFVAWPGLVVEWNWWTVVELPQANALGQVLRVMGLADGTTAVLRNLRRSSLFE